MTVVPRRNVVDTSRPEAEHRASSAPVLARLPDLKMSKRRNDRRHAAPSGRSISASDSPPIRTANEGSLHPPADTTNHIDDSQNGSHRYVTSSSRESETASAGRPAPSSPTNPATVNVEGPLKSKSMLDWAVKLAATIIAIVLLLIAWRNLNNEQPSESFPSNNHWSKSESLGLATTDQPQFSAPVHQAIDSSASPVFIDTAQEPTSRMEYPSTGMPDVAMEPTRSEFPSMSPMARQSNSMDSTPLLALAPPTSSALTDSRVPPATTQVAGPTTNPNNSTNPRMPLAPLPAIPLPAMNNPSIDQSTPAPTLAEMEPTPALPVTLDGTIQQFSR